MTKEMKQPATDGKTDAGSALDKGISFDMPTCGGCRTCEMACAFHHLGEFNPSVSSLQILEKEKGPGYRVWLATQCADQRLACDVCKDLEVPLCLEYCREYDDLFKILKEFEKKSKRQVSF